MSPNGFERHDHRTCIAQNLAAAQAICAEQSLQLTPVRRRVLEILLSEHRAMGAYDILGKLSAEGLGHQPPVAYRALDFLVKHRLAHKVEQLNAFVACAHPGEVHAPAFLICRACDAVSEAAADPSGSVSEAARAAGFAIEETVVEARGLCPDCLGKDTP